MKGCAISVWCMCMCACVCDWGIAIIVWNMSVKGGTIFVLCVCVCTCVHMYVYAHAGVCAHVGLMSVVTLITCNECGCEGVVLSADRGYVMLFRKHVSRKAAGNKARPVLEGVGLDVPTIDACFSTNPKSDEAAVQDGLTKWAGGKGTQPPTWTVLIEAMDYAEIAQQDITALKKALGH